MSRDQYSGQYIGQYRDLIPYTNYTVGIMAQDGNLENATVVYESFTTKEAGKQSGDVFIQFIYSSSSIFLYLILSLEIRIFPVYSLQ